jgi:hypothetical protein
VDHHSLGVRPCVEELRDLPRVILDEQNVTRLTTLDHVVEIQSKYPREARRNSGGRGIGVRDGNADLFAARFITLGILARKNDELRNQDLAPVVMRPRRAPM